MSEFALIDLIRSRTSVARSDVELGIGDDAAVLNTPAGWRLVTCTDTLVAGVHFPRDTAPGDIGWKSLAVNLSDLAAMGAQPAWALLALTLPDADAHWVERFADGFAELAHAHRVALVGGDTTRGPLSVTVTAMGWVPAGEALTRAGAGVGDAVYVTGELGGAAAALHMLQAGGAVPVELRARLDRPQPRLAAGLALRGIASACIDVSDGLVADLGHLCAASGVGAELEAAVLPLSPALLAALDAEAGRACALSGGDDYELCFSVPAAHESKLVEALTRVGCRATRIGRIVAGSGVRTMDADGASVATARAGWEHFSQ